MKTVLLREQKQAVSAFLKNEVSDERVIRLLHFLLTNTIFQDLLKDLEVNVLYVEEGCQMQPMTENWKPKCLFPANGIEEGWSVLQKVKPHVVILHVSGNDACSFVERMKYDKTRVVVICEDVDSDSVMKLLSLGVKHFVMPPITPQAVLKTLHESLYKISLEKEAELQKSMLRTLMEFQSDLLFIVEDDEVTDCNTTFLHFFGYEDLPAYQEKHITFADAFLEEKGYYVPFNKLAWIDDCLIGSKKVKMMDSMGEEFVFLIRSIAIPDDMSRFLVIGTDITDIEKEYKENERLATIDSLTNIYNRFKFQTLLQEQWDLAKRRRRPLSVIVFDVDDFQKVNDTYGHDHGDLILAQLADLVSKHINTNDVFARWGGEEFIILLPNTTGKQAFVIAESLRFFIQTKKFTGISKLTASFGVAECSAGLSREEFVQRAHEALSEAKQKGKNQVCVYRERKGKV